VRIVGLDLGARRIGVAVSDAAGLTAQPVTVIERGNAAADVQALCAIAKTHEAGRIVVGLPLTLEGARGPQAQRVGSFVDLLRRACGLPIVLVDERFTTAQAARALRPTGAIRRRGKGILDVSAAQLILQTYLDGCQRAS